MLRLACLLFAVALTSGCRNKDAERLGPPEAYVLLAPTEGKTKANLPVMARLEIDDPRVEPLVKILENGFAAELLRTVYLVKGFLREATVDGRRFPDAVRSEGADPVCFVVGRDATPYGRGLALKGFLGATEEHPSVTWLGLPDGYERDKALVQTVSGRLATFLVDAIATGGTLAAPETRTPIAQGYRMAMEVIAREWRTGRGPQGVVPHDAGSAAQRALFAGIRENRFVLTDDGQALRPAAALLDHPGVAATVLYRLAQAKGIANRPAPDEFYAPFTTGKVPPGISPAAVLGTFRNFQAKLLGVWGQAALRDKPPRDIVDLLQLYTSTFPAESNEVIRVFVVTTFGATVKAGGASHRPQDATRTLDELTALAADVAAGRRSLRDATAPGMKGP